MSTVRMPSRLLRRLSALADLPPTDADLLARFVATRDDAAFAELVHRHGPTILAVCRRVTGNRDDADDAFQSTFLVFARKADRVRPESGVGGWLYGVAVRASRAAVSRTARRRARETTVAEVPEVPDRSAQAPDPETIRAVLEAVAGLSDAYRAAVVLCELEGRPRAIAARELGIPEGTLSSRLSAARRVLAARLRGRDLAALAVVASSVSCPALAADSRRIACASAVPSPMVEKLAEVVMRSTDVRRKVMAIAVALIVVGLAVAHVPVPQPEDAPAPRLGQAVQAAEPSRLIVGVGDQLRYLNPEGKEIGRLTADTVKNAGVELLARTPACALGSNCFGKVVYPDFASHGRIAPDGRIPLATRKGLYLVSAGQQTVAKPVVAAGGGKTLFAGKDVPFIVAWSADSRQAVVQETEPGFRHKHTLIDTEAGTVEPLVLPTEYCVIDWSPDGTWFLAIRFHQTFSFWKGLSALSFGQGWSNEMSLCRLSRDGKTVNTLVPESFVGTAAISPDGMRVAYQKLATHHERSADGKVREVLNGFEIVVLDLATGTKSVIADQHPSKGKNEVDNVFGLRWSPDGTQLVYANLHVQFETPIVVSVQIQICKADGSGKRTVFATKPGDKLDAFTTIDWR